jgi:hypothetical protein
MAADKAQAQISGSRDGHAREVAVASGGFGAYMPKGAGCSFAGMRHSRLWLRSRQMSGLRARLPGRFLVQGTRAGGRQRRAANLPVRHRRAPVPGQARIGTSMPISFGCSSNQASIASMRNDICSLDSPVCAHSLTMPRFGVRSSVALCGASLQRLADLGVETQPTLVRRIQSCRHHRCGSRARLPGSCS